MAELAELVLEKESKAKEKGESADVTASASKSEALEDSLREMYDASKKDSFEDFSEAFVNALRVWRAEQE